VSTSRSRPRREHHPSCAHLRIHEPGQAAIVRRVLTLCHTSFCHVVVVDSHTTAHTLPVQCFVQEPKLPCEPHIHALLFFRLHQLTRIVPTTSLSACDGWPSCRGCLVSSGTQVLKDPLAIAALLHALRLYTDPSRYDRRSSLELAPPCYLSSPPMVFLQLARVRAVLNSRTCLSTRTHTRT
jgi:hypothetical protein